MWFVIRWGINFFGSDVPNRRRNFNHFSLQGGGLPTPTQSPPLVVHHDLPMRKNLTRVLGLDTVIILKRVIESIFFQSKKSAAFKIKD